MLYFTKQACRPSHDKKGLKDWANACRCATKNGVCSAKKYYFPRKK
jgi:hypothetical protein